MANEKKRSEKVQSHILSQFRDTTSQKELKNLSTKKIDWLARTEHAIMTLLPRMPELADTLVRNVPANLNSSIRVLEQIRTGEKHLEYALERDPKAATWYKELSLNAEKAILNIGNLESQQVSAEIQRIVVSTEGIGDLVRANGSSIYPDLILIEHDYSGLSKQNRKSPIEGPCLRGKSPSNIPDGCEIKTNQGKRIKVDAHGAHAGLHLGVTWDLVDHRVIVTGVWLAYVKFADHREGNRNVKVTTVKYSFGHELFISLLDS